MNPEFSVVIPTYLRPTQLMKCLDALSRQQLPHNQFEIIVVDDGDDRATAEIVQSFREVFGIEARYLAQAKRRGPAAARNRGWRAARGRIIAFTEDDCMPHPDWLPAVSPSFKRGAQAVSGQVKLTGAPRQSIAGRSKGFMDRAELSSANFFCLPAVLERVGGFTEDFDIAWREDSDLQFKLIRAGVRMGKCPEAVVEHPVRKSHWNNRLREERKYSYDALLYKRHPELYRQRMGHERHQVLEYYGAVFSFITGVFALLSGHSFVAVVGLAVWLLLTAEFLIRFWPKEQPTWDGIQQAFVMAVTTPYLSIFWRLHGAVKYRVLYW